MNIQQLIDTLYPPGSAKQLTPEQQSIVRHPNGPAWVLAGPGSGKTEVLTVLVSRLLYVENDPVQQNRIMPESIFVTTFTEKAARNLEDRIAAQRTRLVAGDPSLAGIDVSKLRIGTLHGLCNDLLQEFRAPNYQNVRLMDEFEQALFVREHMSLIKQPNPQQEIAFWSTFPWLFTPQQWQPGRNYPPNRWNSTKALVTLLNRIVEDRVSVPALRAIGGQLGLLADLYDEYRTHLQNNYRSDFAQLQLRFFEFLATPLGQVFRDGDGTVTNPGIQWVLVDEYQDTNPIQEAIYFQIAGRLPHNLVVVGDDDQAMYRFRGGSVECMVTFDGACQALLATALPPSSRYPLVGNFRSHPDIVAFFDEYIRTFPVMNQPGSRAPKPSIVAMRSIAQAYPAVGTISGQRLVDVASSFAATVRGLVDNGIVNNPSECCLLLKTTRESPRNAGPYVDALNAVGLVPYNPRNKSFMEQEEVQGFLGAILAIVDPNRRFAQAPQNRNTVPLAEADFRNTYSRLVVNNPALGTYVQQCTAAITNNAGQIFDANLQELAYYVLSCDPFSSWQQDPARRVRLARLTQLLEAYASTPVLDPTTGLPRPNVTRGFLRASSEYPGEVINPWLASFYHLFIGYVTQTGFDDEEDEEVICPLGMVPVMTMHQSKGLEFPFVFVGHMGETPDVQASHRLESLFSAYPANPARSFPRPPENERAEMDLIRQYYVAYSRAKYALILLGTTNHFAKLATPQGPSRNWLRQRTQPL